MLKKAPSHLKLSKTLPLLLGKYFYHKGINQKVQDGEAMLLLLFRCNKNDISLSCAQCFYWYYLFDVVTCCCSQYSVFSCRQIKLNQNIAHSMKKISCNVAPTNQSKLEV